MTQLRNDPPAWEILLGAVCAGLLLAAAVAVMVGVWQLIAAS